MEKKKKEGRYLRMLTQLEELCEQQGTPLSRMSTISAVLHNKMEYFFWTGFYLLEGGDLYVGPYQGPVACQLLERGKGVCWATVERNSVLIVPDVTQFPDHISCDSRSKSEITVPVRDKNNITRAVLDIDAKELDQFDAVDGLYLEKITELVYK